MIVSIDIQKFLTSYAHIPLLLLTFILLAICLFLNGSRILRDSIFWDHERSYYDTMTSVWNNMTVIKRREVMPIIDFFDAETPRGNSLWKNKTFVSNSFFCP